MSAKHGNLSINSDNIFPIIKKWMYSDHDIFVRELVSNGCDAITKLKKLDGMGEYTLPDDYKAAIQVIVNPDEKTLKFIDNGIGMTAEELENFEPDFVVYNASKAKVENALISTGRQSLEQMIDDNEDVNVECHFCDKNYKFTPSEIRKLLEQTSK